jgi:hypothetical protein
MRCSPDIDYSQIIWSWITRSDSIPGPRNPRLGPSRIGRLPRDGHRRTSQRKHLRLPLEPRQKKTARSSAAQRRPAHQIEAMRGQLEVGQRVRTFWTAPSFIWIKRSLPATGVLCSDVHYLCDRANRVRNLARRASEARDARYLLAVGAEADGPLTRLKGRLH